MATTILFAFIAARLIQLLIERRMASVNFSYFADPARQSSASQTLRIEPSDMAKSFSYATDKAQFARITDWTDFIVGALFIAGGGLGLAEAWAVQLSAPLGGGSVVTGLLFFGILSILTQLYGTPQDYYYTFRIEQKHGFNRQTVKMFFFDRIKSLLLTFALGGLVLSVILLIMESAGNTWWFWAWVAMSVFSILTVWLYPTFLAPLFNKFSPLGDGDLKTAIEALAQKIGFRLNGLMVMDASKRTSHGNAYFTGMFGAKQIVLFDTLIQSLSSKQVVAVLAHELGHFKLHHVRGQIMRSLVVTGVMFYGLSLCLAQSDFYLAFSLAGPSNNGAIAVFGLWFSFVTFLLQPLMAQWSRRNEFAADKFAVETLGTGADLAEGLLKLRETSHQMPIVHPAYSRWYYSHPPMLERLRAIGYI